jgi:hypothetical protein
MAETRGTYNIPEPIWDPTTSATPVQGTKPINLASIIKYVYFYIPALSPTVLSVMGSLWSGSLNERVIKGNTILSTILERRCVGREELAAPGPSETSRAWRDAEEDVDSMESRGDFCSDGDRVCVGDSDVLACS